MLVSVCIRTYNQKQYIEECLNSILMQKTAFDYEIIVADDCSSDGTIDILQTYKDKYPSLIRLLLGQHVGGTANLKRLITASQSKYIALCDGDDYWTDPYKMQKQVDILEFYGCVGCFHNVINRYEHKNVKPSYFHPIDFPTWNTWKDIVIKKWFMPINGEMFVRQYAYFPDWYESVMNDDYVLNLMIARNGDFYYLPDAMAVYRHNEKSESNSYTNLLLINNNLKCILQKAKLEYNKDCWTVFESRISEYEKEIEKLNKIRKYPWIQFFQWRFYKRRLFESLKIQRIV